MVRKDSIEKNPVQTLIYEDTVIRDSNVLSEKVQEVPPIMSQKSLDFIVDSLNTDFEDTAKKKSTKNETEDYEVIIKLPNGKQVKMRAVEETQEKTAKEVLKKALTEKVESKKNTQRLNSVNLIPVNSVPIAPGTIIPGTLIPVTLIPQKMPIIPLNNMCEFDKKPVKRKVNKNGESDNRAGEGSSVSVKSKGKKNGVPKDKDLDSRCAASRRYR